MTGYGHCQVGPAGRSQINPRRVFLFLVVLTGPSLRGATHQFSDSTNSARKWFPPPVTKEPERHSYIRLERLHSDFCERVGAGFLVDLVPLPALHPPSGLSSTWRGSAHLPGDDLEGCIQFPGSGVPASGAWYRDLSEGLCAFL